MSRRNVVATTDEVPNQAAAGGHPSRNRLTKWWRSIKRSLNAMMCVHADANVVERYERNERTLQEPVRGTHLLIEFSDEFEYNTFSNNLLQHGVGQEWHFASINIKLTEEAIRKAAHKVYWDAICKYQDVSHELLMEFSDKINIHALFYSQHIKYETIRQFFKQLQRSHTGASRRPTQVIKRVIRQDQMVRVLSLIHIPRQILNVIKHFLGLPTHSWKPHPTPNLQMRSNITSRRASS